MSIKSVLPFYALSTLAMLPTEEDWQKKIDKVLDEYWNDTIHLPRKAKKKRRKELNSEYSFLVSMKEYNPLNNLFK